MRKTRKKALCSQQLWAGIVQLMCVKSGSLSHLFAIASENWQHSWCHGTFSMVKEEASDLPQYVTDFISMKSDVGGERERREVEGRRGRQRRGGREEW
jgi:hypothetical protein